MVGALLGGAVVTAVVACLVIRYQGAHGGFSVDLPGAGPQKFHRNPTPRVGGVPLLAGLLAAAVAPQGDPAVFYTTCTLLTCALPAFAGGLIEDVSKRGSVKLRLILTFVAAALAFGLLDARITGLELPLADWLLAYSAASFAFTLFAVGGFSHALNIVDGFNGLAGVLSVMLLGAIAYVAYQVGDTAILGTALLLAAVMAGFLLLNFPRGLIFLGDGGAYLVGFLIAELAVLLTHRNSSVSPWFPLLLLFYPVVETMFSVYRKKVLRGRSPGEPDGLHLHMLIYKRCVRSMRPSTDRADYWANAMTAPYLWCLALVSVVPAVLFWDRTPLLQVAAAVFVGVYLAIYWGIVRFRVPGFLSLRRRSSNT